MKHLRNFDLKPIDPRSHNLNVIVETPKGSRTKFKYDNKSGLFLFDKALPVGQSFPFDFGFLPSTVGEDGDPLDVLILADQPTFTGCLIVAKLLGVVEAEQIDKGERKRNDRFVAVPLELKTQKIVAGSPEMLDSEIIANITKFFITYNELQGREFNVLGVSDSEDGMTSIKEQSRKSMTKAALRHRHHLSRPKF